MASIRVKNKKRKREATAESRRFTFKHTLQSPCSLPWSVLSAEDTREVLGALLKDVAVFMAQRRLYSDQRQQQVKAAKKALRRGQPGEAMPPNLVLDPQVEAACQELCIGANQVIRALEKDAVEMFVVAQDVKPSTLVAHLAITACLRKVPFAVLGMSSSKLGALVGTRVCMAVGFRRAISPRNPLDESRLVVRSHCSYPDIPWLSAAHPELQPPRVDLKFPKRFIGPPPELAEDPRLVAQAQGLTRADPMSAPQLRKRLKLGRR